MCDEYTEKEAKQLLLKGGKINRRDFSKMGAAAMMAAMLPEVALASAVTESVVEVAMPDGVADCYFVHPAGGKHPGVILWPDLKGLRPAYEVLAKRLAADGYSVLVVNPYYRDAKVPVVPVDASFDDVDTMDFLRGLAEKLTPKAVASDAKAYVNFLDTQDCVDRERKIGTMGYCMGGELIMRTAAAVPNRVGAAASFHGGWLGVYDGPDSTHLLIPGTKAHVLHAIAENDDKRYPETKEILTAAYQAAGLPAEIEVYKDTVHGWCTLDYSGYNELQAERAWTRLLHLFNVALA